MAESREITAEELHEVRNHPPGNRRIVHHEQGAAQQADPAVQMPKAALRFQSLVSADRTLFARASHRKLHGEHRYAHDHQKEQVKEHKETAAVGPRHIGKFPDISDSDGATCTHQNKSQPGPKTFSLHESNSPVTQKYQKTGFSLPHRSDKVTPYALRRPPRDAGRGEGHRAE